MDQKILSELGDYLLAHREEIIGEWLRAVEQNPDISSFDHLKDKEELRRSSARALSEPGGAPKVSAIGSKPRRGVHVLHESMANTAGDKGTGSRKSYARRASSEELFPIIG